MDYDNPKRLGLMEQNGYDYAKGAGSVFAFFCEDCATTWAAYYANTTIARPDLAQHWRMGFMRAWRELHATFEKKWPYV